MTMLPSPHSRTAVPAEQQPGPGVSRLKRWWNECKSFVGWSFIFLLGGTVIEFAVVYWRHIVPPHEGGILFFTAALLDTFAIAFISLGVISFLVDLPDWQAYFRKRLASIIVQRDYLTRLSKGELVSLQADTLKAYFENEEIDRAGSFLEYFDQRIRRYIGSPYREDVRGLLHIKEAGNGCFDVIDTISYKCRRVCGQIQKEVIWLPDEDECQEIRDQSVTITLPYDPSIPHDDFPALEGDGNREPRTETFRLGPGGVEAIPGKTSNGQEVVIGYRFPLDRYRGYDGLGVRYRVEYRIHANDFMRWVMVHPTRKLSFHIDYPEGYEIVFRSGGIPEGELRILRLESCIDVEYDSWVVPHSGFFFELRKRSTQVSEPTPVPALGKEDKENGCLMPTGAENPPSAT